MLSDNRLGEARTAIVRAIDLAPGRIDYRLRYADICILEGNIAEASALLTELAKVTTDRAAVEGATRRLAALAQLRRD
jgi:thioredoxin-like negative regulator of GroEL